MISQSGSDYPQYLEIELVIIPEDQRDSSEFMLDALKQTVRRNAVRALRKQGYRVRTRTVDPYRWMPPLQHPLSPPPDVTAFFVDILTDLWEHRDALDTLSALCTIFGTLIPIAYSLLKAVKKRLTKDNTQDHPVKVTIMVDDAPIQVEASDLEGAEIAMKLAQRFQARYPSVAAKVTPKSKVKVKGSVPKSRPRGKK